MIHSTRKPTKAEAARMEAIREFGCIACYLDGMRGVPCVVHHMLSGNKRIGHDATIGLCPVHHKHSTSGVPAYLLRTAAPSWHEQRRAFRERYGSDTEMVTMQSELIGIGCYD